MAKLKAKLASLDGVPEAQHEFYEQGSDGGYTLAVEPVDGLTLADPTTLHSTLEKEREQRRQAESTAKAFGELKPDAVKKALRELEELKAAPNPDEKAQKLAEARIAEIEAKFKGEIESTAADRDAAKQRLEKLVVDNAAQSALSKTGAVPQYSDVLLRVIRDQVKVEADDNGEYHVRVLKPDGTPRITQRQGASGYMDLEEYVSSEMRQSYPDLFKGSGASGSGAQGRASGNDAGGSPSHVTATGGVHVVDPDAILEGKATTVG